MLNFGSVIVFLVVSSIRYQNQKNLAQLWVKAEKYTSESIWCNMQHCKKVRSNLDRLVDTTKMQALSRYWRGWTQ